MQAKTSSNALLSVTSNYFQTFVILYRSRDILDDFREAYYWLWQNTKEDATVMSWWDYGYQIAGMANRTTLVDNNTWNNSHIAMVRNNTAYVIPKLRNTTK